jgi:hypothetical protein
VRGDALLDAYEIYSVPFDEAAILQAVANMRNTLIAAISGSARAQDSLTAMRTGQNDPAGSMRYGNVQQELTIQSQTVANRADTPQRNRKSSPSA